MRFLPEGVDQWIACCSGWGGHGGSELQKPGWQCFTEGGHKCPECSWCASPPVVLPILVDHGLLFGHLDWWTGGNSISSQPSLVSPTLAPCGHQLAWCLLHTRLCNPSQSRRRFWQTQHGIPMPGGFPPATAVLGLDWPTWLSPHLGPCPHLQLPWCQSKGFYIYHIIDTI